MNDKPQLGMIRINANGALFEIPYFEDAEFDQVVIAMRLAGCYHRNGLYIHEREIAWMVRVPSSVVETSTMMGEHGPMTRQ